MVYDSFRKNNGPTLYASNKTPVTVDVLELGLVFAIVILALSFILTLPGFTGRSIVTKSIKALLGVLITGFIMLCNFGQEWEIAHIETKTQYRAGLREEIEADIGVKIGLRSVNITLKASESDDGKVEFHDGITETINYNERFSWDNLGWVQGRGGFGPFAGRINQEFREGQRKGLPYPILWIAEYFTIDGEGIRWGRYYRQAGYYSHILMWLAFPTWILSMILMHIVVRYGGYMSILTSILLFAANIVYATLRNPFDLVVPFEEDKLEFRWGWCFWLNIINGFLCFIIGLLIVLADVFFYDKVVTFFGIDILSDYEEIYADSNEITQIASLLKPASKSMKHARTLRSAGRRSDEARPRDVHLEPARAPVDEDDDAPPPIPQKRQYRKRTIAPRRKKKEDIENGGAPSRAYRSRANGSGDGIEMDKYANQGPNRL